MSALYFLIPMSLLILAGAVAAFFWALRKGHYEDMQGPANSIVFDDRDEQLREERLREEKLREEKLHAGQLHRNREQPPE